MQEIAVFDIGNTNIKLSAYKVKTLEEYQIILSTTVVGPTEKLLTDPDLIREKIKEIIGDKLLNNFVFLVGSSIHSLSVILSDILKELQVAYKIIDHDYNFKISSSKREKKHIGLDILGYSNYVGSLAKTTLAIMLGTACVSLFIDENEIQSASIMPGISLSFEALLQRLSKSKSGNQNWKYQIMQSLEYGYSTSSALNFGYTNMILGIILGSYFALKNEDRKKIQTIYLSGMDIQNFEIILSLFKKATDSKVEIIYDANLITLGYLKAYLETK
ncbi:type III pantothenate kinase [Mycoplasmopsis sturni]|uniref:type III pantothenate kinase n=1 Tax=Mycoplasmopsis sturni TaxID=39047 RepID=UPI00056AAB11|nr:type III pantothenate kinase [Mycoplasmopsis sturni]